MKKLELYYYDACPFCQMVMNAVDKLNLKVDMKNTMTSQENAEKLFSDTGRRTVPCLYIDGEPMFESRDIINWLQQHEGSLERRS